MMAALCALSGVAAMELMQCVGVAKRSFLFGWTVICAVFSVTWYYDRPEYMEVLWFLYVLVTFFFAIYKAGEIKLVHILAGLFAVIAIPYSFLRLYPDGGRGNSPGMLAAALYLQLPQ